MDNTDILPSENSQEFNNSLNEPINQESSNLTKTKKCEELDEHISINFQNPTTPNINAPEKIIFCLDVCYDDQTSVYRLEDGTTYTPFNMLKRVLEFFIHTKHAINKKTEFALLVLKDAEPCYLYSFTNNIKDLILTIDYIKSEESSKENFDFHSIFDIIKQEADILEYKKSECLQAPSHVVRMIVLYARSNCIPLINQEDPYFIYLKKQPYFYIDILLMHQEDCSVYKCEEVYDVLQDLDNGYSYVFEVSRNAAKIHDCFAKLLAHPLQRPLQKNTSYSFPYKY